MEEREREREIYIYMYRYTSKGLRLTVRELLLVNYYRDPYEPQSKLLLST